jgi:protein arginine kinase
VQLSDFGSTVGEWLKGDGPESDIVVSSRIRLARNLAGRKFQAKATPEELADIESEVGGYLREREGRFGKLYYRLAELDEVDRHVLVERHLISREHAAADAYRAVAASDDERLSIMINEEDHLRVQVLRSGMRLAEAWQEIDELDTKLSGVFEFAFHQKWGYLTACPTNVGTAVRVSVMVHLPALVLTREIEKVFRAMAKINLAVRGLYGEGTQAYGDLYQISNQTSLGKPEEKIIGNIESIVPGVIAYERKARAHIVEANRAQVEDRLWRALGMLAQARLLTSEETMHLLSAVRLGVNTGVLPAIPTRTLNELFLLTQPAHLQKVTGRALSAEERDVERAVFVRKHLESYS